MKTRTLFIALLIAALAAGGWWFLGRGKAPAGQGEAKAEKAAAAPTPDTPMELAASELQTLATASISRTIPITGTLRPAQQALVRAKASGELRELLVREGENVRAGQVLARIDTTDFETRIREREAQLRSTEAQLEQARRTLAHNRQLFDKGFISQSALDTATLNTDAAAGNRDAANAQLVLARKALADTAVVANLSGVVAERFVQPGEKVSPDNRILSIVDLSRIEIEAAVPAAEIGTVRIGQVVSLKVEGIAEPQIGRVLRISPGTSTGTRSVPVWIGVENPKALLRAGLFAQGSLAVETRSNALVVPVAALRDRAGRNFVYAIENDRLIEKTVTAGLRDESGRSDKGSIGIVEITEGLKAGDRIVAVNLGMLRVGAPVRIR